MSLSFVKRPSSEGTLLDNKFECNQNEYESWLICPNCEGIGPDNFALSIYNVLINEVHIPISLGICPDINVEGMKKLRRSPVQSPICEGRGPVSELVEKLIGPLRILLRRPSWDGSVLVKRLFDSVNAPDNLVSCPISEGTVPPNKFPVSSSDTRLLHIPISEGSEPESVLAFVITKEVIEVNKPICEGNTPTMWLLIKYKLRTSFPEAVHVTPNQLPLVTGQPVPCIQFVFEVQALPPVLT
jgi:hypothetical protein